jgi:hypothetical protein
VTDLWYLGIACGSSPPRARAFTYAAATVRPWLEDRPISTVLERQRARADWRDTPAGGGLRRGSPPEPRPRQRNRLPTRTKEGRDVVAPAIVAQLGPALGTHRLGLDVS